jgi:hypothetical protein
MRGEGKGGNSNNSEQVRTRLVTAATSTFTLCFKISSASGPSEVSCRMSE